ncbi:hypothetical protein PIB30_088432 [Stylosanthes scabra]|uniref:SWIM-type domain-containing protein n=1 Tax=Stylosanthes scabra TaxID=79078 RepID=A0ABU6QTW3_9FABA|nr:hypothetical protein [Stylosanthes scabra]
MQISGLPCKHGAAAIVYIREKVENYCDAYYNKDKYILAYSGMHSSLPNLDTLDDEDVLPPHCIDFQEGQEKIEKGKKMRIHHQIQGGFQQLDALIIKIYDTIEEDVKELQ